MTDSDFFSFEKALDKLSLEEEDLKRLISAGEIRAFRDGSRMRLRAEDVARVAHDLGIDEGAKPVAEEDAGEVLEVEEVLFSEAAEEEDDQGMVTTQLSEEDTLLDEELEEVEMDEEAPASAPAPAAVRRSARTAAARGPSAGKEGEETSGVRAMAILTTVFLVYGLAFLFAMAAARSNGLTNPLVNAFSG
ncbi:MAG: hypothetical protein ACE5IM_11930 [Nitrospinota bacterium]